MCGVFLMRMNYGFITLINTLSEVYFNGFSARMEMWCVQLTNAPPRLAPTLCIGLETVAHGNKHPNSIQQF